MNPASLAIEIGKTAMGKESSTQLLCWILVAVVIDAFLKQEITNMQPIYTPAGYDTVIFMVLVAFAIIGPLVAGLYFKNESKHADEDWSRRYIATLIADVVLSPLVSLIVLSLVVQAWFPDIDPVSYIVLLPLVQLFFAFYTLKGLNQGFKAMIEQLIHDGKDVQEGIEMLQQATGVTLVKTEAPAPAPAPAPEVKTVEKIVYVQVPAQQSAPAPAQAVQTPEAPETSVELVNGVQKV